MITTGQVSTGSMLATLHRILANSGILAKAMNYGKSPSMGQVELLELHLRAIIETVKAAGEKVTPPSFCEERF